MTLETLRPLPQFVVIGAMKSGTTSLYYYMRRHPEILVSDSKELDFFVKEKNWQKGTEWYRRQFASSLCRSRGEFSTNYAKVSLFKGVPRRMATVIPQARLIYLLRNPFDRFASEYRDHVLRGVETSSFASRQRQCDSEYACNSDYFRQLGAYLRYFDRRQILLVSTLALRQKRALTLRKIYSFLGVDPSHSHHDDTLSHNEFDAKWQPELLPSRARRQLILESLDETAWNRKTPVRDALDRSVRRLAMAFPQEKWILRDLSCPYTKKSARIS